METYKNIKKAALTVLKYCTEMDNTENSCKDCMFYDQSNFDCCFNIENDKALEFLTREKTKVTKIR